MGSNNLKTLPGELFKLDRLAVLSLRGNQLNELPPGIGKLRNLRELNISHTALRYLPYEILDLFSEDSRLQNLQVHPNPFFEPTPSTDPERDEEPEGAGPYKIGISSTRPRRGAICGIRPDQRRRSWNSQWPWQPQWKVSYKYRSEIRYLDISGRRVKGFDISPKPGFSSNLIPIADIHDRPKPPSIRTSTLSRAPSLLEVSLNACAQTNQLQHIGSLLPDESPSHLSDLLAKAAAKKESGASKCTICKRNYIIPRTEWIEWWEVLKTSANGGIASAASPLRQMENERDAIERKLPLMRRGCSWRCAPTQSDSMLREEWGQCWQPDSMLREEAGENWL